MAVVTDTFHVRGIRCERCVNRLAGALRGHDGLEWANATLAGSVTLSWDDARTTRASLAGAMAAAGFPEIAGEAGVPE